jgi:hypothetical protein
LIDNSFHPFIPLLQKKAHYLERAELHPEITRAQKEKDQDPSRAKAFEFGDYKI